MDQKEHIATLCALGTVGAAATGLAFATDQVDSYILRPWKRKWPRASGQNPPAISVIPAIPRRSVTQPTTPTLPSERLTSALHSTQSTRLSSAPRPPTSSREDSVYDAPSSRGSSKSRRSILRARTASSRGTTEKRDSSSTSGWLKRLSSFSSRSVSPAPSEAPDKENDDLPPMVSQRPSTSAASMPNKLVKRSLSQRGISHDEARGQILRRPATSHQRSQVFREILDRPVTAGLTDGNSNGGPSIVPSYLGLPGGRQQWRPYFETSFPRKRRRSETAADSSQIRVLRMPSQLSPTMLLGSELEESQPSADIYDRPQPIPELDSTDVSNNSHRPRRSLNSTRRITRRRNYTDPSVSVSRAAAQGKFFAVKNAPDQSEASDALNFSVSLPPGSPQFPSSPPLSSHDRRNSFWPRVSIAASDPPTTSSDADGRVFSDAESLDFQSDTAYDSVATRATNLSRSGIRDSKLDTIFAARTSDEIESQPELWQHLESEELQEDREMRESPFSGPVVRSLGIGITLKDKKSSPSMTGKDKVMVTPPRSASLRTEDFNATPVPLRTVAQDQLQSSPPLLPTTRSAKDYDQVGDMLEDMKLEGEEDNDWSINNDPFEADAALGDEPRPIMSSPGPASLDILARFQDADPSAIREGSKTQQDSIFQWSENQHVRNYSRPKTVDGKQTKGGRSRSSGRKGPPQLHFRSQSVPVNREGSTEDLPSTSKYQTWRLGHKPVSEEWSDDFEFDDVEQVDIASPIAEVRKEYFGDSVRSVKIPQAIIDRQPSVHLQFGQVQEFMALVEEMKRLRLKGATLQILDGPARHLWEDAEGIINLATINDDDDDDDDDAVPPTASSPASSDPFTEIPTIVANSATNTVPLVQARRPTTSGRRSVSTMTPPPVYGRARGESLAHARHFLQAMHQTRDGRDSSPREIEIHQQKRLPFDTQDLKDLVVRSGAITRALKDEVRRAEGLSNSPKTPPAEASRRDDQDHPLSEIFKVPQSQDASPCPPFRAQPGLPKSRSANSYLESPGSRQHPGPFSSPITLAAMV